MKNNNLFKKAFEYSVRGYSVIPLKKDKTPLLLKNIVYQRERQATEEEIENWWKKNPDANIGICTGKISGITVIDIDTGGDTVVSIDIFPATYTVKTPTGGYHLYYKYDSEINQTANTYPQFPHVDIRNDGGYVVAPPSVADYTKGKKHIKGKYTIEKSLPLVDFPRSLFLSNDKSTTQGKISAKEVLKGFPKLAEGDGRNVALTKVIGKIVAMVSPKEYMEVAYPMALSANNQFKKPLSEKEVKVIFNSIIKHEEKKPLSEVEFLKNDRGIINNEENVYRTINADPLLQDQFRLNTFVGLVECKFERTEWESMQRSDVIGVRMHLMRMYPHFSKVPHASVEDAIIRYANNHQVSPPVEWLKSLVWDKTPRLDTWLCSTFGVADDVYHRAVGSNWMKGLVKRIVHPGSKFDYVLVLEGKQGTKKSTSLAVLGGSWHVETVFTPDNKDFFMLFGGKAIVEFSEGETLSKTEAKHLKAIITMQFDKYRPPYERAPKEFPRQCVFAMTTNQEQYLKDETGNRRWLPIACQGDANIKWLEENREQLFAEAYHRVIELKETTYEFPEEETRLQQLMRQTVDPREEQVYEWYFHKLGETDRNNGITTRRAYIEGVHGGSAFAKEMGRLEETITGTILLNTLHLEKRRVAEGGDRFNRYFPTSQTRKIAPKQVSMLSIEEEFKNY